MSELRTSSVFDRIDQIEMRLCMLLNNSSERTFIRLFFRVISRLGDGVFWYSLLAFLPYFNGKIGYYQATHILVTALSVLVVYKYLKKTLVRERPYISFDNIQQAAPALDRYSFPSGHTMHALSFAIMFSYYLPADGTSCLGLCCLSGYVTRDPWLALSIGCFSWCITGFCTGLIKPICIHYLI